MAEQLFGLFTQDYGVDSFLLPLEDACTLIEILARSTRFKSSYGPFNFEKADFKPLKLEVFTESAVKEKLLKSQLNIGED